MNRSSYPCRSTGGASIGVAAGAVLTLLVLTSSALPAQRMRIGSSNPTGLAGSAGFVDALFAAGDTKRGVELWHHDSSGATNLLVDIYPGSLSGYPTEITRRSTANGNTWMVARVKSSAGAELGRELVFYPKLPSATTGRWVKDIRSGSGSSHPSQLTLVGTRLFFTADNGTNGVELWTSNGTTASTYLARDILAGAGSAHPFGLIAYNGKCYFAATDAQGTELWASDGSAAGTVRVKDIRAGAKSSTPSDFAVYRGRLYFAATTDANGRELWSTDGSSSGTVLVADIVSGSGSSAPSQLTSGASLAFTAWTSSYGRELYLRGATGAPVRYSALAQGETIAELTAVGSGFWFRASTPARGHELWRTTSTGVVQVHDLRAGASSSFPSNLFALGSSVLFRADNGVSGVEYWRTNGTTATLIRDIRPGSCPSRPSRLTSISTSGKTRLLFAAKGNLNGIELWQTDGVTATLAKDIDSQKVLPGLHWGDTPTSITIDVKDATPSQTGALIVGTGVVPPLRLPFVRGALSINLALPNVLLFFRTDARGLYSLTFQAPRPAGPPTSIVSQAAVTETSGMIAISVPGSCNQGAKDLNPVPPPPNNGPKVEGRICLDDESGEYMFCAARVDTNNSIPTAFIGLYQKGPGGDLEFIQSCPIHVGDFIEDGGQIEILLPLEAGDPTGRHLEMHLFTEPPTPTSPTAGSLVTTSYC